MPLHVSGVSGIYTASDIVTPVGVGVMIPEAV